METLIKETIISSIEKGMVKSCFGEGKNGTKRRCGDTESLTERPDGVYHGFLADWDGDSRVRFYLSLTHSGYKTKKYEADYYWTVEHDTHEVSYVEGDVYVKFK